MTLKPSSPAVPAAAAQPDSAIGRVIDIIQREYVVPVSLSRLLQLGVDGIGRARPSLRPEQMAAVQASVRPLQDDSQRVREFAKAVLRASYGPPRPKGPTDLVEAAIVGIMTGLDAHSSYISSRRMGLFGSSSVGGVGLELTVEPVSNAVVVVGSLAGSPAEQANIKPGDVLKAVDGLPVTGLPLDDTVDTLRGNVGSNAVLDFERPGGQPLTITITRQHVQQPGVRWSRLGRVAYFYPGQFDAYVALAMRKAESSAKAEAGGQLEGAILDLRGNTGGLVDQVALVARDMLASDRIIFSVKKGVQTDFIYRTAQAGTVGEGEQLEGVPLIVLVDGRTAAGAEILAGALQDHGRAVIAGSRTYGAGTIQKVMSLGGSLGSIRFTSSKVYLPSGRALQRAGVSPDIRLHPDEVFPREAGLPDSLPAEGDSDVRPMRPGLAAIRAAVHVLPARTARIDPAKPESDPDVAQALKILSMMRE